MQVDGRDEQKTNKHKTLQEFLTQLAFTTTQGKATARKRHINYFLEGSEGEDKNETIEEDVYERTRERNEDM